MRGEVVGSQRTLSLLPPWLIYECSTCYILGHACIQVRGGGAVGARGVGKRDAK